MIWGEDQYAGWMIGFYGATATLMSAVAPYPAGLLSDRLGRGHALILASALSLTGLSVYLVAPTWWMFILLLGGVLWGWNPRSPFILGGAISGVGFLWFALEGILSQSRADDTGNRVVS